MKRLMPYRLPADASEFWTDRCVQLVTRSSAVADLRSYVDAVVERLRNDEVGLIDEALRVALPIVYRLALDDTSSGYRVGAEIKEQCCRLRFPEFHAALNAEVDHLCRSYYLCKYSQLDVALDELLAQFAECVAPAEEKIAVYGRKKTPYSIFEKLLLYSLGAKSPKCRTAEVLSSVQSTLAKFEENILARQQGKMPSATYRGEALQWILPDTLALTIQLPAESEPSNFGLAKHRYKAVFRHISSIIYSKGEVYFGPYHSGDWHMNRMVFYATVRTGAGVKAVPFEAFIRNDRDYFVGYANYWRYKNVDLLAGSSAQSRRGRDHLIRELKDCSKFEQVQAFLLNEINSGQLALF